MTVSPWAAGDRLGDHDPFNGNLYVGTSSIFAAALGLAPSKDVFWSNSTQRYPVPPALDEKVIVTFLHASLSAMPGRDSVCEVEHPLGRMVARSDGR